MRLAVVSDIHANLHALEAVWADLETQKPDTVFCLGDLVGYGAHPNEVVDFIRERSIPTVWSFTGWPTMWPRRRALSARPVCRHTLPTCWKLAASFQLHAPKESDGDYSIPRQPRP